MQAPSPNRTVCLFSSCFPYPLTYFEYERLEGRCRKGQGRRGRRLEGKEQSRESKKGAEAVKRKAETVLFISTSLYITALVALFLAFFFTLRPSVLCPSPPHRAAHLHLTPRHCYPVLSSSWCATFGNNIIKISNAVSSGAVQRLQFVCLAHYWTCGYGWLAPSPQPPQPSQTPARTSTSSHAPDRGSSPTAALVDTPNRVLKILVFLKCNVKKLNKIPVKYS